MQTTHQATETHTPPIITPDMKPQKKPLPVAGFLKWILRLAWVMLALSLVELVSPALYTMEVLHPGSNETITALAYTENFYPVACSNEEGLTHGKDWRDEKQKAYDEDAYMRVVSGKPDLWYDDEDCEDFDHPEKVSPGAATLAYAWDIATVFLGLLDGLLTLGGGVLTILLTAFLLHNARIVDSQRPHASTAWTIASIFVPIASLFVFPRELYRAWRGVAEADGQQASCGLLVFWWIVYLLVALFSQLLLRSIIGFNIVPHWVSLSACALDPLFYLLCILLFSRMRHSLATA